MTPIDYDAPDINPGGVAVAASGGSTPLVKLDDYCAAFERLDMLKVDVEGYEAEVIAGAVGVICRHRPLLYVENDRDDRMRALVEQIEALGYRLFWHLPPLFDHEGRQNAVSVNMFCVKHRAIVPNEHALDCANGLKPVIADNLPKFQGAPMNDQPMSLTIRAYELHAEQRDVEALRCLTQALALEPELVPAQFMCGEIARAHGDYASGWSLYELRHCLKNAAAFGSRYLNRAMWDGKPTSRRVLIWAEQGFGDTIQMLRFIPEVRRRCPNMVLEVQPELLRLCKSSGIEAEGLSGRQTERWGFDLQCSLMSLPLVLGITVKNIPNKPYLRAPWLTENLLLPEVGPRVGLCWRSESSTTEERIARRMTDEQIKPLAGAHDFVSLQREHMSGVADFADTAVLLNQLDLVITIDTAIAHLAAALGKSVWLMASVNCCWRWLQNRADSPWYPTVQIFRQEKLGEWGPVLERVSRALRRKQNAAAA